MKQTLQDWLHAHAITHIECLIPDLNGLPRGKLVPVSHYPATGQLRFPQVSLIQTLMGDPQQQLVPDNDPDMVLTPDLDTLCVKPGAGRRIAQLIHDCHFEDGRSVPAAPRGVLREVLAQYRALGLTPVVAPEIEFYLLDADGLQAEAVGPAYSLDHSQRHEAFFAELEQQCHQQGIATDILLHEVGNSQYELNLQHGDALRLADQVFLLKRTLRALAASHGLKACFMAKPFAGQPGSAMHIHQSLVDDNDRNTFSQADGDAHPRFAHFIAGLQRYLPAAMALMAPNPNAYRRLAANTAAPINVEWGYDNRSCGLRIPASSPQARRVENRLPGIDGNPYLALAATLGCGLLGLREALAPSEPLTGSAYGHAATLPRDLSAALQLLDRSEGLASVLGEAFTALFVALKQVELDHFQQQVTAWEQQYLLDQA
ncbi:glutamine synthetase family protein [Vogesella sp. LIG4]|uniref:glutamine synthetase family protein n=1 Tax=Vogesella sp. LIG4 TaxID=1192162 RepID=UPI00081F8DE7|nr:glutamine synthetase family protein [Vogesella sp. LIG4]SCK06535.1 L-glutamine synthetase [Vogesella sp. LIG4]